MPTAISTREPGLTTAVMASVSSLCCAQHEYLDSCYLDFYADVFTNMTPHTHNAQAV